MRNSRKVFLGLGWFRVAAPGLLSIVNLFLLASFLIPSSVLAIERSECAGARYLPLQEPLSDELFDGEAQRFYEVEVVGEGVLAVEVGSDGASIPEVRLFDETCSRVRAARVDSLGGSSVMFLPFRKSGKVFLSIGYGGLQGGESFWVESRVLAASSPFSGTWGEPVVGADCGRTDEPASEQITNLSGPDLEDPIDEAETEVMPTTGSGTRWAVVFHREPEFPGDEPATQVMPITVHEPALLRIRAQTSLGLVALEEGRRCAPGAVPGEAVLVDPFRELLAFLEPGEYRLRSLQPLGAGWADPSVEVLPWNLGAGR